jgi:hypothetical protein
MVIALLEFTLSSSLLIIFEIIVIIGVLEKLRTKLHNFYTVHKPFLTRIGILYVLIAVTLNKIGVLKAFLLIILVTFVHRNEEKKEQAVQINTQEIRFRVHSSEGCPIYRKNSLSKVLNDDEKWLDLLDQGYFLCNRHMKLIYTNKRGEQFMSELDLTFGSFIQQLIEAQETNLTLRAIMEKLIGSRDGNAVKADSQTLKEGVGIMILPALVISYLTIRHAFGN